MALPRHELVSSIGLLILRLGIGGYMLAHGWGKWQMMIAGSFDKFGDPIGLGKCPSLVLMVFAEFICSMLIMLGLCTRLAGIPIVIGMAVAAFVAHGNDPWTAGEGAKLFMTGATKFPLSKEPALLFLIPALALIFTGAGKFSLDALIWPRLRSQAKSSND